MSSASPTSLGLVVLGMHRSGTSLLSHLLGAIGYSFGGRLVPAHDDNPLGYWEHADIVAAHDYFLLLSGRAWDDPRRIDQALFEGPAAEVARRRLAEIFSRELQPQARWVLKDPRHCRLLPLWTEIFDDGSADVRFLHLIRDPYAVAGSLAKRNGMPLELSLLLWLRHVLEAERNTRDRPRTWLRFEALANDPSAVFGDSLKRVGGHEGIDPATLARTCADIFEPGAVHHRVGATEDRGLGDTFPWIEKIQAGLDLLANGDEAAGRDELDAADREIETAERLLLGGAEGGLRARLASHGASSNGASMSDLSDRLHSVTGLVTELKELSSQGAEQIARISSALETSPRERDLIAGLETALSTLHEAGELYKRTLKSNERRLLSKSLTLLSEVEARQNGLLQRCASLESQNVKLLESHDELAVVRGQLERAQTDLEELRQEHQRLTTARDELSALHDRLTEEHRVTAEHERQLDAILAGVLRSKSWRLTAPLRAVMEPFKRDRIEPAPDESEALSDEG